VGTDDADKIDRNFKQEQEQPRKETTTTTNEH
jgi:hypothetical protein